MGGPQPQPSLNTTNVTVGTKRMPHVKHQCSKYQNKITPPIYAKIQPPEQKGKAGTTRNLAHLSSGQAQFQEFKQLVNLPRSQRAFDVHWFLLISASSFLWSRQIHRRRRPVCRRHRRKSTDPLGHNGPQNVDFSNILFWHAFVCIPLEIFTKSWKLRMSLLPLGNMCKSWEVSFSYNDL